MVTMKFGSGFGKKFHIWKMETKYTKIMIVAKIMGCMVSFT